MSTDRELLEKAAKAAGYEVDQRASFMTWRDSKRLALLNARGGHTLWNAEEDDGDALRLLTKLPFRELYVSEIGATVSWRRDSGSGHGFKCDEYASEHGDDLNAATRRAIVRAAAALEEPHHAG